MTVEYVSKCLGLGQKETERNRKKQKETERNRKKQKENERDTYTKVTKEKVVHLWEE